MLVRIIARNVRFGKPRHRWKNNDISNPKERMGMWAGFKWP